jgi:hypothetical protein
VKPVRLGDWTTPTGNNVVADLATHGPAAGEIRMAWDAPPPLSAADERYYTHVIRPAVLARAAEYMERPMRRALVVTLG